MQGMVVRPARLGRRTTFIEASQRLTAHSYIRISLTLAMVKQSARTPVWLMKEKVVCARGAAPLLPVVAKVAIGWSALASADQTRPDPFRPARGS